MDIGTNLCTWAADELRPDALFKSVVAGFLTYLLGIIIVLSFGALIFSGDLASQLPYGIGLVIVGDALFCLIVAVFSSYPGSIGVEQDVPSAILAVASAAIMAALPAGATTEQRFATVVVMIACTTILTGLIFLLLGGLRLGGLVRFLPYPVMGGFLAGTGWLLAMGAIGVMTTGGLGQDMFLANNLIHWLPGALLGALMLFAVNRFKGPLVLPSTFVGAIVAFYLVTLALNIPLARLSRDGWLLGPFPAGSLWQFPLSPNLLTHVDWPALATQIPALAPAAIISVIALLLNASGLELVARRDIDPNRELLTAGLGNVIGGLAGGLIGYHAISLSTLNHALSGSKRLPGLLTSLLIALTVVAGASALNYVPRLILGGLLFFLGLTLLEEWVYRAWFKFPRIDLLIVLSILAVIAVRGFLEGIAVGIVLTILIFVVNYSRISIVKHGLSGSDYRSRVTRNAREREILDASGDQIYISKLQGFIFFGTANNLFAEIKAYLEHTPRVRFVVLDFREVTGLDSTGLLSFSRMVQLVQEKGMTLILTGESATVRRQFEQGGLREQTLAFRFFPDLDHGIEWCEKQILAASATEPEAQKGLREQLEEILPGSSAVARLMGLLERSDIGPGEYLIRQGDDPDRIFFIESGQVTAQLEGPDKQPMRLQTMRGGHSVGELGFYLGLKRTASVIADEPSVIYCMSKSELARIESSDPEVASVLHRVVVQILGYRVVHLTRIVDALES